MAFRNMMEDIVTAVVDKILFKEDKTLLQYEPYKQDIITYVLNRIPPKYYTSERGVLHGKLDSEYTIQQRVDMIFSTYEAIKIIRSRRGTEIPEVDVPQENKIYCLPHVIGEVFEKSTFAVIPDIKVHLLHNGGPVKMKDKTWKNPYSTSIATAGYYHFWPELSEEYLEKEMEVPFEIIFEHNQLQDVRMQINLQVLDTINVYKSHVMPIQLLEAMEGVDVAYIT